MLRLDFIQPSVSLFLLPAVSLLLFLVKSRLIFFSVVLFSSSLLHVTWATVKSERGKASMPNILKALHCNCNLTSKNCACRVRAIFLMPNMEKNTNFKWNLELKCNWVKYCEKNDRGKWNFEIFVEEKIGIIENFDF